MAFVANIIGGVVDTAVDLVEGVVDFVFDAVDFVVDEIIQPVVSTVGDVIEYALDNPIEAIAKIGLTVASGGAYLWAMPLLDGAITIAKGGSLEDAVKSAAISYAGGKLGSTAGQFATKAIADAGGSAIVANIVGAGTKSATTALVYGQDPLKAFATGGLQAGIAAGMGKISETMEEQYGSRFEDLQDGVKDTIFAGLAAELEGGNLSETQLGGIINKYSGVGDAMNKFLKDNAGFNDTQAAILTNATAAAVSKAIAGNPDGAGEEFFNSISAAGAEALKTIIDKPVNNAIDRVTGAYDAAEAKAKQLNDTVEVAKNAADTYNSLQSELAVKVQEQARLEEVYNTAVAAYNANPSEAGGNAANAAAEAYNEYARALETDYNNNYKTQMANAETTFTSNNAKIADLEADYNDAMGWVVSKAEDLDAELKPKLSAADKAVALSLRPNFDEDAYRKLNGLDAGADVYDHFLQQGQKLPTDLDGANAVLSASHSDLIKQILATEGMDVSSMEPESLRAVGEHVVNNVKSIKDIAGLDFDSFASEALNKARDATPKGGVLPTGFSREDGILDSDIANGEATLGVTSTGELQWQSTKKRNDRLTGSGSGSYTVEDIERSMSAQMGGVSVKFVGTAPTLPEMIDMAMEGDFGSLSTATLGTIASLSNEAGRLLDEYATTPIYDNAKAVYNYLNEETDGGLGNAGSIAVGAGGEILQAVAGLAVLAGANPNNSLGRTAKNMIALSGDMKSDEWKAAAEEMEANSAAYDKKWREDNPGKEPSTAMKGLLKAQAIWGNIKNHPVQWVSENVVSELLQEVPILLASGGTGNVAKRLLLEAGEAHAKKVAARVAIGTGVSLDAAEAFGGTAAGAFDEAYSTALNTGMSDQEATDYAMDVAQKAGTIAVMTLAATAGIGGQALSKSIFGDKGSKTFTDQYNVIKDRVVEGTKVTVQEGVTEFIEEALPQLYIASSLVQIDPTYDVAGSVFEAGIMGKLAGAGTAGGIYTGNALADSLLTTNSTVKNAVANSGDATKATQALKDLGISDNEVLNNLLNTTYDTQYVTTTEAGEMFTVENPGFIPTDAEIEALAGKKDESNLAAEVAAYVDPRFLDVDEVKAAAAAEGITLTDEQAKAYEGQKDEAGAVADIAEEYDPQATTRVEAEQFFANVGYTPTEAEITARMGATPETEQKENIAEYVDPRQVTEAEARKFYEDLGYNPTDAEIAQFVGQGGNNFEGQKETGVKTYVDPRMVDADEVSAAYADLGLSRPTDADIQALIGQYMETDLAGRAEENLPTARYNSIMNILDNFTGEVGVSDEVKEALETVKGDMIDALGDLGLEVAAIDQAVTDVKAAVDALPVGASPEDVSTAINDAISGLENISAEDVNTAITTALEGMNNLSADDVQGIVDAATGTFEGAISELETDLTKLIEDNAGDVDTALAELAADLGTTEEALLAELGTTKEVLSEQFTAGLSELETDLTKLIEDNAGDVDTALAELAADLGTTEEALLAELGTTKEVLSEQFTAGLSELETDLTKLIEDNAGDVDTALAELAADLGTTEEALLAELGTTKEVLSEQFTAGLSELETDLTKLIEDNAGDVDTALAELAADLGTTEEALLAELGTTKEVLSEQFTAGLTALEEDIGGVAAGVDDLAALVEDYEAAGVDRDTALSLALEQLSTELGQTETDILAELGLTEAELGERIDASTETLSGDIANAKADLLSLIEANEAAGLTRDEATQTAIGELANAFGVGRTELLTAIGETEASLTSQITDVEASLGEQITDVETNLGADIEAVADLIGKPARDVTQTDIDFVIDLIAQENVSQELITQYDVNADGTVDIADQTLLETALQGDQDVTLADTSMFTPATGLYLQQEQDTQATQDLMTELNTQLNTQINTQDQQQKLRDLVSMEQQGLFKGAKTTVSSVDPMNIDYLYDFSSVFANPSQEGLFASPYSTTTRNKAANQPTGPMPTASGFAEGGQVEDENDMLLRILGEM